MKFSSIKLNKTAAISSTLILIAGSTIAQAQSKHLTLAGIPSALVAPNKTLFAGLGFTNKRSVTSNLPDGSGVIGYAIGSAEESIGFQVASIITSLDDDFADSGYFSLKASRRIFEGDAPIYASLGFGYLGSWGDSKVRDETATLAFTRFSELSMDQDTFPVMMTVGAGNDLRNNNTDPGVFIGLGVGLTKNFAVSAAYTGQSATLGTGFKFDQAPNISFGLSIDDAFNDIGDRRLIFTVGFGLDKLFGN